MTEYINKGAIIIGDYRYHLWREWRGSSTKENWYWHQHKGKPVVDGDGKPWGEPKFVLFVMLNPSTADGAKDDATIRRCVNFAKLWGYDALSVVNLFAYRTRHPKVLLSLPSRINPEGPRNQEHIEGLIYRKTCGPIVCAWGSRGDHLNQDETVLGWLGDEPRYCFGLTRDGHPRHPLYVPNNTELQRFK